MIKIVNEVNFDKFDDDFLGSSWEEDNTRWYSLCQRIINYTKENSEEDELFDIKLDKRNGELKIVSDWWTFMLTMNPDYSISEMLDMDYDSANRYEFNNIDEFINSTDEGSLKNICPGIDLTGI